MATDFSWLIKQAKNKYTKNIIKELEKKYNQITDKTKHFIISIDQKRALKIGNWKIWLNRENSLESLDTYCEIFKARTHTKLPQFPAKNDLYVVDLGANEGLFALKVKDRAPKAKIICVEPNPSAFETLRKNIRANNLKDIVAVNKAVTSRKGKIQLEVLVGATSISALKIKEMEWFTKSQIKKIPVKATTLNDLFREHNLKKIDLLKLDVEGSEMDILSSSKAILPYVKKIVVEYHSTNLKNRIKKLLRANKFKLLFTDKDPSEPCCGDLYFIKK